MMKNPIFAVAVVIILAAVGARAQSVSDNFARSSTTIADNFDRADGGLGANWTTSGITIPGVPVGAPTITNHQVLGNTANGYDLTYYTGAGFSGNQFAQATVPVSFPNPPDPNGAVDLIVNGSGNSCYLAQFWNGNFRIDFFKNNVHTTGNSVAGIVNSGDVLRFESVRVGYFPVFTVVLSLYKNGQLIESVQDSSTPLIGGNPGLGVYGNGTQVPQAVLDNFIGGTLPTQKPDQPDLTAGDLGTNWSVLTGSFGINSGVVSPTGSTNSISIYNTAIWSANIFTKDQSSQATIANPLAANDIAGVAVRVAGLSVYGNSQAQANGYIGFAYGGGGASQQWYIKKLVPMNGSILLASGPATWNVGDTIKLSVSGIVLTLYQNGNVIGTAKDGSYLAGNPGIFCIAGGAVKNWFGSPAEALSTLTSTPIASDNFQRAGTFPQTLGPNWKNLWGPSLPGGGRAGGFSRIITSGTVGVNSPPPDGVAPSDCGTINSDDAPLWIANSFPADQWSQMTTATSIRPSSGQSPPPQHIGIGVDMRQTDDGPGTGTSTGYTYVDTLGDSSYVYNNTAAGAQPAPRFIGWYSGSVPFNTLVQKGGPAFQPNDVVLGITLGDVIYGYLNGILELQIRDTHCSSGPPQPGLNDFNCYNVNSGDHRMTSWSAGSVP